MPVNLEQGKQLIHAGKNQELLRFDPGHPAPVEDLHDLISDRAPVPVELGLGVDLLAGQARENLALDVPESQPQSVGQRMGRIGRGDRARGDRDRRPRLRWLRRRWSFPPRLCP